MTYRIKEFNEAYLKSKGFVYDYDLSFDVNVVLSRRSTVKKYNNKPILEVIITIASNNQVTIDVYSTITQTPYSAWYNRYYGKNKVVEQIDNYIKKECRKLRISHDTDRSKQVLHRKRRVQRVCK